MCLIPRVILPDNRANMPNTNKLGTEKTKVMTNSIGKNRDHFVPRFYLRRWAEGEFLWTATWIAHKKELYWKNKPTRSIGCKPGLYKEVEKRFFEPLDTKTDNFIKLFKEYDGGPPKKKELSEEESNLWARYILAQYIRIPENVNSICDNYFEKGVGEEIAKDQLPSIISNSKAIEDLRNMLWVFAVVSTNNELITSDNPLIFKPNDLSNENCVLILPMGPQSFFLATHHSNYDRIEKNQNKMVSYINQEILRGAREWIFMRSKHSISHEFIKQHWKVCT